MNFIIEQDQPGPTGPAESREDDTAPSAQSSEAMVVARAADAIAETAAPITDTAGDPPVSSQAGGEGEAGFSCGPASPTISEEEDIPECLRRTA